MTHPTHAGVPPARLALVAAASGVLVFAVCMLLHPGGARTTRGIDDGGQLLVAGLATALCAGTARARSGRERTTWALLTGFAALWAFGAAAWFYSDGIAGRVSPSPTLADAGYLLSCPLAIAATVRMASPRGVGRPRLSSIVDTLVLGGSLFFISWALVLDNIWTAAPGALSTWVNLAYPGEDIALLAALILAWPRAPLAGRRVLSVLVAGLLANTVADSVYAAATASGGYSSGYITDTGWVIGFLTIGAAALLGRRDAEVVKPAARPLTVWRVALPYLPLFVALLVWLFRDLTGHDVGPLLELVGFSVIGLVVARQVVTLTENLRLNRGLEAEVRDTTGELQRFRAIVDDVGEAILIFDPAGAGGLGLIVDANTAACRLLGHSRQRLLRLHPGDVDVAMATDDPLRQWSAVVTRLRSAGRGVSLSTQYRRADGATIPVEGTVRSEEFAGRSYVVSVVRDATERKRTDALLQRSERSFRELFDANPQPMWVADELSDDILAVNDAAVVKYGYPREEFLRLRSGDLRPSNAPAPEAGAMQRWLAGGEAYADHQLKNGDVIEVELRAHPLEFEGRRATLVLAQDVTSRKTLERRLRHQAYHHPLTNLANRTLLYDRAHNALDRHRGRDSMVVAVLLIDLDGFKLINDTMGHAAGDEVLLAIAARLLETLRPGDTAAHIGGDEFAVLLEVGDAEAAATVAWRLCEALRLPLLVQGSELFPSGSIGVALSEGVTTDAETLLRDADIAMYAAKTAGKNRVEVFDPELHQATLQRMELRSELRRGLERSEFLLEYQPIYGLEVGGIRGLEALLRWDNPRRGRVAPLDFIGLAEETGHIVALGSWVLREACTRAVRWNAGRSGADRLYVSVNLSPRQLREPNFVEMVIDTVRETGLQPTDVVLEVTEGAVVDDMAMAQTRLNELRRSGFRIAMDDFGAGYSSLAYLKDLPIDIVKIDRLFVAGVGRDIAAGSLVTAIVRLLGTLDVEMVAEGIENASQLSHLRELGVHSAQGYLLSRPLPERAVAAAIRRGGWELPAARGRGRAATAAR